MSAGCSEAPRGDGHASAAAEANRPATVQKTAMARRAGAMSASRRIARPTGLDSVPFARALTPPSARVIASRSERPAELDLWNPPAPQLLAPFGPDVLGTPRIVPVFYAGDSMQAQIEDFTSRLGGSSFWAHASEYGVGAATSVASVILPQAPPARLSSEQVDAFVRAQIENPATSGFPARTRGDIYVLLFPPETTITLQLAEGIGESCKQFGAYHSSTLLSTGEFAAYAVIPRCNGYLGLTGIDSVTSAISHEAIEAATDPFGGGYVEPDWQGSGWSYAFEGGIGAEVADFCEFQSDVEVHDAELGFLVQRYYSNTAAAAFRDPCVPAPNRPYFNVLPIIGGMTAGPFAWAKGVAIPPGGQATIPLKLFSDAPTDAWELSTSEGGNPHLTPDPFHQLSFSFDNPRGKAGDVRYLTIKRSSLPPGVRPGPLPFSIVSTLGSVKNVWWVVVGQ